MNATPSTPPPRRPPVLNLIHLTLTVGFGVAFQAFDLAWDSQQQWLAALALIALFGLPHGALDPLLAYRRGVWRGAWQAALFLLSYLALVGLMLWFWQHSTASALALFLLITAWHFSADWRGQGRPVFAWLSVALLLGLSALAHPQDFVKLFALLLGDDQAVVFQRCLALVGAIALPLALATAARGARREPGPALELLSIALGGFLLPPLWFFTLYFCVLHSPRHLRRHFGGAWRGAGSQVGLIAAAFSLPVVAVAAWYALGLPRTELDEGFARILLAGLFALTVPHVLLLEWVENRPRPGGGAPG